MFAFFLSAITEAPSSQVVELGDSASFYCAASGGSFRWVVHVPSLEFPLIISQTRTLSEYGITADVSYEFNTAIQEYEYTSTLAVEGRVGTNNTELYCEVTTFETNRASSTVELTVIGNLIIIMFSLVPYVSSFIITKYTIIHMINNYSNL